MSMQRELDKLVKHTAASRLSLLRTQANRQMQLEQALKGWMQPKRVRSLEQEAPCSLQPPCSCTASGTLSGQVGAFMPRAARAQHL